MAETRNDHAIVFLFLLSITLFSLENLVIAGPNGFSLKLIHRDSIESPLYPGNLTQQERVQRLVEQSKARIRYLANKKMASTTGYSNQANPEDGTNGASLPTIFDGQFYLTYVGIGSFSDGAWPGGKTNTPYYNYYYMILDTVTDLIWTQCDGCTSCIRQSKPLFPYKKSTSYRPLPCNDTLCEPNACSGTTCSYDTFYYRFGLHSTGVLGTEKFTVGLTEVFRNIVFGCGLENRYFKPFIPKGADNKIAGVLGIGKGPKSFLTQTGDRGGGYRFSYCLQNWTDDTTKTSTQSTFLRFGEDAKIEGPDVHTISMYNAPGFYYLNFEGISVQDRRVHFQKGTSFEVKTKEGKQYGGCIIDTGTHYSTFYMPIYRKIIDYVELYFVSIAHPPVRMKEEDSMNGYGFRLCYHRQPGFNEYPSLTFHFKEDLFVVDPLSAFYLNDQAFCLAIHGTDSEAFDAVIGTFQTTNHRFLFDVKNSKMSFARESCVVGA